MNVADTINGEIIVHEITTPEIFALIIGAIFGIVLIIVLIAVPIILFTKYYHKQKEKEQELRGTGAPITIKMKPFNFTNGFKRRGYPFLFIGILRFCFTGYNAYQEFSARRNGELVNAEVISVKREEHYDSEDEETYYTYLPTFRFEWDGEIIEKQPFKSKRHYDYPVGTTKQIYYSAKTGHISANDNSDFWQLFDVGLGFIFSILGIIGIIAKKKEQQEREKLKEVGMKKEGYFAYTKKVLASTDDVSQVYVMLSPHKNTTEKDTTKNIEPLRQSDMISESTTKQYTADTTFTVYVDPLNTENYFVDLASVKQPKQPLKQESENKVITESLTDLSNK